VANELGKSPDEILNDIKKSSKEASQSLSMVLTHG
jgi:hypothetical protein